MAEKKEREITRQHHKFQVISHDLVGLKMLYRPLCARSRRSQGASPNSRISL
ncbi:hypothetical protein [Tardiphaga sp. OK246]|jgi:hypothetical protein|uniref:hypothetical protein n=1 Tax=Tardiphaga sp. OK246 TaxID=1855307 RepID=UPI001AF016B9|nr:hypothetical protein [Tardiphaga sp. OK246]